MTLGHDRQLRRQTMALAGIQAGDQVLDVGCGTGSPTLLALEQAGAAGKVVGIDASPEMIGVARRKAGAAGAAVDFRTGLIEALPFADAQFGVVLSSLMMHHLPGDLKRAALLEIRRVLKPGGRLLVVDARRPKRPLDRMLYALLMHGALASGIEDVVELMREVGYIELETGALFSRHIGYVRGARS